MSKSKSHVLSNDNGIDCLCLYTNADKYMNKRSEMKTIIETSQPDLVGITEVKPKQSRYQIEASEISHEGYESFHNLESGGRGVVLLVYKKRTESYTKY